MRSPHLRQLATQHLHALFDSVRINGVKPHPKEVSRRRVAENAARRAQSVPGVGGAPGQLLGVDLLRRGQPERVGVFAAGDDLALRQMLLQRVVEPVPALGRVVMVAPQVGFIVALGEKWAI